MEGLFFAHSGLRYLLLLSGLVAFVVLLAGKLGRKPYVSPAPALYTVFVGLVDFQVAMGIVLYFTGRTAPGLLGHFVLMLCAAVALHLVSVIQRKRPQPTGHGLPLTGVVLALCLIVLGILALGRSVV